ncbi:MAG: flavin reductase family protein [Rhodospirillaceae bacterium]
MSRAAASVSVVTTNGPAGREGITVSSMTSVSADPPSMLVCLHADAPPTQAVLANGVFCVNLLRDDQAAISNVFAGIEAAPASGRFGVGDWVTADGMAPRLANALASFQCRTIASHRSGSHFVVIGEVTETLVDQGKPLIYGSRSYGIPRYHGE